MKKLYITGIFCALISTIHAQYVGDALRFSESFNGGTARSVSMGGAFGALGGDFGALSSNPAGLGVYRMSEFTLSPSFYKGDVTSRYFGTSSSDYKYDFNLNNLGVVFNNTSKKESGLISTSFAIGFNRLNNFNNYYLIQGQNEYNSIGDYFLDNAYDNIGPLNPDDLDPFYERLAFDAYIIDTLSDGSGDYFTEVPLPIDQVKTLETSGGVKEWSFSFGGNYNHTLFFGATFGLRKLRYEEIAHHKEYDNSDMWVDYGQTLDVRGTGYNFKLGVIYKPIQMLRIGLAYHSPTAYYIEEEYYSTMQSIYVNYTVYPTDYYGDKLDVGINEYKLITPFKLVASAGLVLMDNLILSAEYEFTDYSTMRLRSRDIENDFTNANNEIRSAYQATSNIKGGAEFRLGNISLRAGMGYYGSPYKSDQMNSNADYMNYNAGIGFRDKKVFLDLAYSYLAYNENYILYDYDNINEVPKANLDISKQKIIATVGFRF